MRTGGNITGLDDEKGVFARCDIPPHTRMAPYLGIVLDAASRGPYCLQVKDAENRTICLDAQSQLYDTGYLVFLSPAQRSRALAPPNYARFANSLRPDQQTEELAFNATFLPDPVEGFSWLISGASLIPADTEILVDYWDAFWNVPSPHGRVDALSHTQLNLLKTSTLL